MKPWEKYEAAKSVEHYTDEQLASYDLDKLLEIRHVTDPKNKELQNRIAKHDHREFAKGIVKENPLMALPMAVATPLYAAGKVVGKLKGRSDPSLEQVGYGMQGIAQGLKEVVTESKPWELFKEAGKELAEVKPWELFISSAHAEEK